jgi:hypothetical protein
MLALTGRENPPAAMPSRLSVPLRAGQYVYARYAGEPDLWHERLILARVGRSSSYAVLTPDGDAYIENFDSDDFLAIRPGNSRRTLPRGLGAAAGEPVYRFQRILAGAALTARLEEGAGIAEGDLRTHPDDYPCVLPGLDCDPDEVWLVVTPEVGFPLGSTVSEELVEEHHAIVGKCALLQKLDLAWMSYGDNGEVSLRVGLRLLCRLVLSGAARMTQMMIAVRMEVMVLGPILYLLPCLMQ